VPGSHAGACLHTPEPDFLQGLREITREYGIPLIFNEVVTGFHLASGGAREYYGVVPDICTLGKVIGGGFPLAAIAGRDDIMAHLDRIRVSADGFMPQVGTLSGNPVAASSGLATLAILRRPGAYERIFANGEAIRDGLAAALHDAGIEATVSGEAPMFDAAFSGNRIRNYRNSISGDVTLSRRSLRSRSPPFETPPRAL
jgi:glutamate-1-semialdehyde 2,1-aminomutase